MSVRLWRQNQRMQVVILNEPREITSQGRAVKWGKDRQTREYTQSSFVRPHFISYLLFHWTFGFRYGTPLVSYGRVKINNAKRTPRGHIWRKTFTDTHFTSTVANDVGDKR